MWRTYRSLYWYTVISVFILSGQAAVEYKYWGDNNINIKIGLYTNRKVIYSGLNGWLEGKSFLKQEMK